MNRALVNEYSHMYTVIHFISNVFVSDIRKLRCQEDNMKGNMSYLDFLLIFISMIKFSYLFHIVKIGKIYKVIIAEGLVLPAVFLTIPQLTVEHRLISLEYLT